MTTGGFPSLYITTDQKLALAIYTTGGWKEYVPSGAATLAYYNWQQVTLVFNGTNTYTIYRDGRLYGTVHCERGRAQLAGVPGRDRQRL